VSWQDRKVSPTDIFGAQIKARPSTTTHAKRALAKRPPEIAQRWVAASATTRRRGRRVVLPHCQETVPRPRHALSAFRSVSPRPTHRPDKQSPCYCSRCFSGAQELGCSRDVLRPAMELQLVPMTDDRARWRRQAPTPARRSGARTSQHPATRKMYLNTSKYLHSQERRRHASGA
jgi:hypothetical protein